MGEDSGISLANQVTTSTGKKIVGVIGATSMVGNYLLSLLVDAGWHVVAFTRRGAEARRRSAEGPVDWRMLPADDSGKSKSIPYWICLAPIWVLPDYFPMLEQAGTRRVVALSSTSRFTKTESADEGERLTVSRLIAGEESLQAWAGARGIDWVILRLTMVYDMKNDQNIAELIRIVRRFGFFPLVGRARGLRRPVHAGDVADACLSVLEKPDRISRAYTLSGGETLSYRDMICRIFKALDRPVRLVPIPVGLFRVLVLMIRRFPRYRNWNMSMAERMNIDMDFDSEEAVRDLNFSPRAFI